MIKNILLLVFINLIHTTVLAQVESKDYVYETFRGTRVVNGHSINVLRDGEMEMIIGHRFGRINGGAYELYGLDQADIRIGLDYGIKDWLTVGAGRSSSRKEFDGFLKLRILRQVAKGSRGAPVSVTGFSSVAYTSLKASDPQRPVSRKDRLAYTYQLLIARKFGDRVSLQLIPTLLHFNLVDTKEEPNDKLILGAAAKIQITKNLALTTEYYYAFPDQLLPDKQNSLAIGFDINTGSHVFQLHFTNSAGMIEKQFVGQTTGKWSEGDIHFGFNMVRTFKLKGRRY